MAEPGDPSSWEVVEGAAAGWTTLTEYLAATLAMYRANMHKVQLQLQGDFEALPAWQKFLVVVFLSTFVPITVLVGKWQAEYENGLRKMLRESAEKRKGKKKKAKKKGKQAEVGETEDEEVEDGKEEELEDITSSLHTRLQERVSSRVEEVRGRIEERRRRMDEKVREVEAAKEEELEVVRAKHKVEVEEVEERCRVEVARLQEECRKEMKEMKKAVRELKVVLSASEVEEDVMEQSRSELECPVCMEEMRPPRRIWQCSDGHPVCEVCRRKPEVTCCPTCRKYIVGRSTIAEKLARVLYSKEPEEQE